MDAYTMHLLKIVVEECESRLYRLGMSVSPPKVAPVALDMWVMTAYANPNDMRPMSGRGPTFTDALTALLTELGVEVPERPSADRARAAREWATFSHEAELVDARDDVVEFLCGLYAREPLTVIAMLEGDS